MIPNGNATMAASIPSRFPPSAPRPSELGLRRQAAAPLVRACIATGLSALDRRTTPTDHARAWGSDRTLDLVLRAATQPATLAGNPQLAQVGAEFLDVLTPASAGADLLNRAVKLNFAGAAQLNVPAIAIPTGGFVAEGASIPVVTAPTSTAAQLTPHKLAMIVVTSSEMLRSPNAEQLVRQALVESCGPTVDSVLFSTAVATAAAPAGLRAGIAGLTPAGVGEKAQALVDDLQTLAAAVAPVAGNGNIILVASPDAAVALVLRLPQTVEWPVLTSSSLAARTVIAVAANAVVSAIEGAPSVEASTQPTIVMDTVPGDPDGSQTTTTLFQSDKIALRLKWRISWALRDARGISWMTNVNW
jgi:hypothetical protein